MKQTLILNLLLIILFWGCTPIYYSANTQNVPMITNKGETNLTFAGNADRGEFQGALGVSERFALMADGGFYIPKDNDNGDGGSGRFVEVGGGYFRPIDNQFVFETYGLLGFGKMENHFTSGGDISAGLLRYGIQPGFGFKTKYFSAAISTRIVSLNYSNIKGNLVYNGENQIAYLNDNKSNFLLEPALTVRGGLEKIKLQVQLGRSFNLSNSNFKQDFPFATVGLNFNFK